MKTYNQDYICFFFSICCMVRKTWYNSTVQKTQTDDHPWNQKFYTCWRELLMGSISLNWSWRVCACKHLCTSNFVDMKSLSMFNGISHMCKCLQNQNLTIGFFCLTWLLSSKNIVIPLKKKTTEAFKISWLFRRVQITKMP